jgi:hypothetical protein
MARSGAKSAVLSSSERARHAAAKIDAAGPLTTIVQFAPSAEIGSEILKQSGTALIFSARSSALIPGKRVISDKFPEPKICASTLNVGCQTNKD